MACGVGELLTGQLAWCSKLDLQGVTASSNMTANATLSLLVESLSVRGNETATGRLHSLVLSGNSAFGDEGPARLAPAIARHPTLRYLAFDDCNMSQVGVQLLADALQQGSAVEALSLSYNPVGDAGAAALAGALPASRLTTLHLRRGELGADGVAALAGVLGSAGGTLRSLSVDQNAIGDAGAVALASALASANAQLAHLDLSYNHIGSVGAVALSNSLGGNRKVQSLWLSSNGIGDAGAIALAQMLRSNSALQTLALWDNGISCDGADVIERALRMNKALTQLFLQGNDAEASADAMARIQRAIERNAEAARPSGRELGDLARDEL